MKEVENQETVVKVRHFAELKLKSLEDYFNNPTTRKQMQVPETLAGCLSKVRMELGAITASVQSSKNGTSVEFEEPMTNRIKAIESILEDGHSAWMKRHRLTVHDKAQKLFEVMLAHVQVEGAEDNFEDTEDVVLSEDCAKFAKELTTVTATYQHEDYTKPLASFVSPSKLAEAKEQIAKDVETMNMFSSIPGVVFYGRTVTGVSPQR